MGALKIWVLETMLSAPCEYLSWTARFMSPDYTGKFFLAVWGKCSGESCQLLLWSGIISDNKCLCVLWKQQWTNSLEEMFRGNIFRVLRSQILKSDPWNSQCFKHPGIKVHSCGGEQRTGAVTLARGTWITLGHQWRSGVTQKWADVGGKWENVYWILPYFLLKY